MRAARSGGRALQIVVAADELLEEAGLEGLTIRAVLSRTGLARRAFYDCFGGKDDLVLAMFAHTLRVSSEMMAAQVQPLPDPIARLRHIATAIVRGRGAFDDDAGRRGERRSAALSREHLRLAEARPAELQKAVSPLVDLIATQIADGMAAGLVREAPVHRLAMLIYNLVSTTAHAELLAEEHALPDHQRRAQLAEETWEFCRRAIAA